MQSNPESPEMPVCPPWRADHRILAVMSAPRFGPTLSFMCVTQCLVTTGIPLKTFISGANWGQNLEKAIEWAIDNGAEWVLTWDYDTILSFEQFELLMETVHAHPEYDAIAPLEVRRECGDILACFEDGFKLEDFDGQDVLPAKSAHFGCTVIKADALRKMPKPWFHHTPAPDGSWGPGHTDDDIAFWHKLREAGGKLGIATNVCIGHGQFMATWLIDDPSQGEDKRYRIEHQHMNDYIKNGPPTNVRR